MHFHELVQPTGNAAPLVPLALGVAKMTVVLATTALLLRATRDGSSQLRYALATAGLAMAAVVPLGTTVLPGRALWTVAPPEPLGAPAPGVTRSADAPGTTPGAATNAGDPVAAPSSGAAARVDARPAPRLSGAAAGDRVLGLAVLVWAAGALLLAARRGRAWWRVHARGRSARRAPELEAALTDLCAGPEGRAQARVLLHPDVRVPLTFGWRRPCILLPDAAVAWNDEQLRIVLCHELVHVRRRDYALLWMVELVRAVYWPHPLVWWLARRVAIERELSCDDAVVNHGVRPGRYAGTLLDVARAARGTATAGGFAAGLAAARRDGLRERVTRILDPRLERRPRRGVTAVALLLLAGVSAAATPWSGPRESDLWFGGATAEAWIEALSSSDPRLRQRAAWSLGELESRAAVDPLIGLLQDSVPAVRGVAAWALGEIKSLDALPSLYRALSDSDPVVREMVVRAVGEHEDPRSVPVLLRELVAPAPAVRAATVWALGEIGSVAAHAALAAHGDPDPAVRAELARALVARRQLDEGAAGELVRRLRREPEPDVRIALLTALTAVADDVPEDAGSWLADADPRVRAEACRLLGTIGRPEAVDALLGALRDVDPAVRANAAWALDEISVAPAATH